MTSWLFDKSNLITRMETMRRKDADSTEKTRWILEAVRWDTLAGHPFMTESQVT